MSTIALEDLKLRVFVDTNVLIDCFVTPEQDVIDFVTEAAGSDSLELVTSDYALWEQNEFIRKHTWVKDLVNGNRSHNEALTYRLKLSDALRQTVEQNIHACKSQREALNILNYNLMDEATLDGDFFAWLELLTIHSTISNQDLLILLSAYVTKSKAILTKDSGFNSSVSEVAGLEETLGTSLLPSALKGIRFINNLAKKPQEYYNEWFEQIISPQKIGDCMHFYSKTNVLGAQCITAHEIEVGDYLLAAKVLENGEFKKVVFRVNDDSLQDYDKEEKVTKASKVTIKLPADVAAKKWMVGAKIFKVANT